MNEWSAVEAVRSFVAALRSTRDRAIAQVGGAQSVKDIVHMAHRRAIPRDAGLQDGTCYSVHGIGCWMADPEGREVDVDIDDDDHEIFDAWRITRYLGSTSREVSKSRDDILMACRDLVNSGELIEPRKNWFRLPHP
ncbi:hypothetical protein F5972_01945 [Microbispora cellulosiformans]|uniref:DUF6896 domain-containing protein n=1 Tax=Microbispora cellulosiformans TaxID=2614688 RepID=A0A5J5KAB1_9ACTN|nr:hypothetical protein [Microbispora cellulosiformans]KAA9381615.1 hypothetical protein F5972_01945 [Microbispora cellulosiformans]